MDAPPTDPFAQEAAGFLRDVHLPRLARALEVLPPEDLWWRAHGDALAFGTLLLHLEGNVRQWICAGLGGAPDARDRAAEFAAEDGPAGDELLARLGRTVRAAAEVIEGLDAAALARRHRIQGFDVTGLHAVLHVVEHFAWHTGQAVLLAKLRAGAGHGIAFHDDEALAGARVEPPEAP